MREEKCLAHTPQFRKLWRWRWKLLSRAWLFVTPWTVALQAPLSMEFSRQNTRVDCHSLLQGIFLTQGLNLCLLYCRQILYHLSHQERPRKLWKAIPPSLWSGYVSSCFCFLRYFWIVSTEEFIDQYSVEYFMGAPLQIFGVLLLGSSLFSSTLPCEFLAALGSPDPHVLNTGSLSGYI